MKVTAQAGRLIYKNWELIVAVETEIKGILEKAFVELVPEWGGFDYSLYCLWDKGRGWREKPDFRVDLDNYQRDNTKGRLYKSTDPDRKRAIEITDKILTALIPICESQKTTRINISCRNLDCVVDIGDL